ncbi:MAG TPA: hypothetical protein VGY54_02790, partial [Polyangiaceae bacterium]|nr:hypothetical protein [Polyangiaceae bacterium]
MEIRGMVLAAACTALACGSPVKGQGFGSSSGAGTEMPGAAGTGSSQASGDPGLPVPGDAGQGLTIADSFAPSRESDGSSQGCSDASKLVYVIADGTNMLYSFAPDKLLFKQLGVPQCATTATANSMAIDRNGAAWVNYDDGSIWKVNTSTMACAATSFTSGQAGFSNRLSMGFSSNAPGSADETLFVSDNTGDDTTLANGKGAARIDLGSMILMPLGGPFTGDVAGWRCELTGTGDARLFGFFTKTPARLAEIKKADGSTPQSVLLQGVDASTGGYAFSFWGGRFWFYTA